MTRRLYYYPEEEKEAIDGDGTEMSSLLGAESGLSVPLGASVSPGNPANPTPLLARNFKREIGTLTKERLDNLEEERTRRME